jgi:hypothetical protein
MTHAKDMWAVMRDNDPYFEDTILYHGSYNEVRKIHGW